MSNEGKEGKISIDRWTFFHFLGGLFLGLLFKRNMRYVLMTSVLFELVENTFFKDWIEQVDPERINNIIVDVLANIVGAWVGMYLASKLEG